jgi:anti-sigma factor RsiW
MKGETRSCAGIRELLLEADPAELGGAGESLLARHLRGCARCAADAERVLAVQRRMADALADLTASATPPASPARQRGLRAWSASVSRGRTRRRLIMGATPLAAAAVLVLLLVQQRDRAELLPLEPATDQVAVAGDVPVVNVTTAHDVAIMKTADPNITVVWYLKRER